MLVPAMNEKEIATEILREVQKLEKTTVQRLTDEYDRERRKLKIDKLQAYPKSYSVKTTGKNTWIIFLQKAPSVPKYKSAYDVVSCAVAYYYSKSGLTVFRYNPTGHFIEVFYGHFFARYNERLKLNLPDPISIVKRFFTNSGYFQIKMVKKEEKIYSMAICKEGMALGQHQSNVSTGDPSWTVHKTFISHDLKKQGQEKEERDLLALLQLQLLMQEFKQKYGEEFKEEFKDVNLDTKSLRSYADCLAHVTNRASMVVT